MSDNGPDFDPQEYSDVLDDVSKKDILLEIMVELKTIRARLEPHKDTTETAQLYRCNMCGATIQRENRETHATEDHNTPPGMELEIFEVVDNG